ncbi:MAG TPA: metal-dependent hydrolase [Anaerolineales bacterium]|nr:metal-dependent hydrolase [Anaerolineales bacterium]
MSIRFTWYGHATYLLEVDGLKIVIDPYFTDNPAASTSLDQVEADFIWVSHGHSDHIGDTVALARRTGVTVVSNHEICAWLQKQDVSTHGQHVGGGHKHPFGYLKFTPALHGSGLPDGTDGGNPVGFLLFANDGKKIYLSGDTGLFSDMRLIGEHGLDLAVIPIGDNYTMGPDDALRAVKFLQPKHVIPVHYNTWELIAQDAEAWARRVAAETAAEVHVLRPGESFSL